LSGDTATVTVWGVVPDSGVALNHPVPSVMVAVTSIFSGVVLLLVTMKVCDEGRTPTW
jgi:hypothetical protein